MKIIPALRTFLLCLLIGVAALEGGFIFGYWKAGADEIRADRMDQIGFNVTEKMKGGGH